MVLLIFSGGYPLKSNKANFLDHEMDFLAKRFQRVILVPIGNIDSGIRDLPIKAEIITLPTKLYSYPIGKLLLFLIGLLLSPLMIPKMLASTDLSKGIRGKTTLKLAVHNIVVWGFDLVAALVLIRKLHRTDELFIYHYWLFPIGFITDVILRSWCNVKRVIGRGHGHDMFSEERGNLLPFSRYPFLKSLDQVLTVSKAGEQYIVDSVGLSKAIVKTMYLGGRDFGFTGPSKSDKSLNVVSVSSVMDYKRVDLIAKVCCLLAKDDDIDSVNWTHIGDGPELENVRRVIDDSNGKLHAKFPGWIAPENVRDEAIKAQPHFLIHLAKWEGLGVALVEALSMGIPCLVTDSDGPREVIDRSVGELVACDATADEIGQEAKILWQRILSDERESIVQNCRQRFEADFDQASNMEKFLDVVMAGIEKRVLDSTTI